MKTPMAKKKTRKTATKSNRKAATQPAYPDQLLREHLLYLLQGGGAHVSFDAATGDWPVQLAGAKVANFPRTAWMLLEHMRLAQWDILEFSRNAKHVSPAWPEGYWPRTDALPSAAGWNKSMQQFRRDLKGMQRLVANPRSRLFARIPHGDGQTLLREA